MRIAMISYHTCPLAILGGKDTGGMNVYVRELTRQLGKNGIHVDVYTRSQDEHVPHVIHDLGWGNRVVHVPAGPELPLPKDQLADHFDTFVEGILDFSQKKNLKYDLIHSHYWMSGLAAKKLKEIWDVPIVHMFHTLGLMKNKIAGDGEFEGDYRIHGELEVLRSSDKIIAATPAELAQLQWLYEVKTDHVTVIPPGVDLQRFYPIPKDEAREYLKISDKHKVLLYVGRIEPLKGIENIFKAIAGMRDRGVLERHEICLSIIGGDASVSEDQMSIEMNRLHKVREELGLDDFVTFLGKRSQTTLPYYYSAADIVVVPSRYESFGMVALESMATGTPVVASQVGGLVYLIQDGVTGFHVPEGDSDKLRERLVSMLDDPEMLGEMSSNAEEYAQNYSWGNISEQVLALYSAVIDSYKTKVS